jgi:hypothetical protein
MEMEPPSLLVTFTDADELEEQHRTELSQGRAQVWGEYELNPGEKCEVVLVHPDTGEAMQVDAKVESVDEDGVHVKFPVTPMVRTRLNKLMGRGGRLSLQERIRGLRGNQRRQMALTGDLTERTALERAFGKEVWDALIENPRLTVGEVVRLARMGSMPLPLVEKIIQNNAWAKIPQIRRALFTNRRLDTKMINRLLRFTPASELRLIPDQTAYPASVRTAARRLMGRK